MSTEKLTRCPHCKAAFKVSEEQLEVANGRVRCGACMNVFDALAYAITPSGNSASQTEAPKPASQAQSFEAPAADEVQTEELSSDSSTEDDELIQDNPEEDYEGKSVFGDELSSSFLELDKKDKKSKNFDQDDTDETQAAQDESWADAMLEEENQSNTGSRKEPYLGDDSAEPFENESNVEHAAPSGDEYALPYDFESTEPHQRKPEHISFYYEDDDSQPGKSAWLRTTLLVSINSLLVISLIILASWFHYEKLVKYPKVAMVFEKTCEIVGCVLPELSDLSKIRSQNLVVRSHPTTRNALIIDTVITNQADFPQDFPELAIYFSDINNQTVAQRLIQPEEYLSEEVLSWKQMPSMQPIHISLELVDPGKEAVNYTLKFFPVKSSDNKPL